METLEMLKPSKQKRQKRRDKRLHEELIECYRWGGSWTGNKTKGYDKRQVGRNFQFSPRQEGMKKRSGGTKGQSDNLQPLIRFLIKKTGKHWDKVYSDLCQKMDKNSMLGQHVFDHLFDFVHTKVYIENKRVFSTSRFGYPVELGWSRWKPIFYVHPKSGVLMRVKQNKKKNGKYKTNW